MRILLDTVAFLFAIEDPDRLSRKARTVMGDPPQRELSVISLAEIAIKNAAGKLNLKQRQSLGSRSDYSSYTPGQLPIDIALVLMGSRNT